MCLCVGVGVNPAPAAGPKANLLSNQFKQDLAKLYELKEFINMDIIVSRHDCHQIFI